MSEIRKIRKPLMEKKRRARINDSLEALKKMLLKNTIAFSGCGGRPTKLEKADILEMTVRYMETLQKRLETSDTRSLAVIKTNTDFVTSTTTCDTSDYQQMSRGSSFSLYPRNTEVQTSENNFPATKQPAQRNFLINFNKIKTNKCEDNKRRPALQEITNSIHNNCNISHNHNQNQNHDNNQTNDAHWRPW